MQNQHHQHQPSEIISTLRTQIKLPVPVKTLQTDITDIYQETRSQTLNSLHPMMCTVERIEYHCRSCSAVMTEERYKLQHLIPQCEDPPTVETKTKYRKCPNCRRREREEIEQQKRQRRDELNKTNPHLIQRHTGDDWERN